MPGNQNDQNLQRDRSRDDSQRHAGIRDDSQRHAGTRDDSQRHAGIRDVSPDRGSARESGSQSDRGTERTESGGQTGVSERERMGASGRSSESSPANREPAEGRRDVSR